MKIQMDALFKSTFGEDEYFKYYKECLKNWPIPFTEEYLDTSFGKTYIIVSGNPNGKSIFLFHGMAASPASWYPNIKELYSEYKIYVPNYPGDFGLSEYRKSPVNPEQAAIWVMEVIKSKKAENPIIVGTSFGAFLCANYSIRYPGFVEKMILISPAGVFSKLKMMFFIKLIYGSLFPKPSNIRKITTWLFSPNNFVSSAFTNSFEAAMAYGIPKLKYSPSVFSNFELSSITCPTLVLLGENEVISNVKKTINRITNNLSNGKYKVVTNAGHLLPIEQPDIVNKEIIDFLSK